MAGNNPEYPPPLPVNQPPQRYINYFRFNETDFPVNRPLVPPLTIWSTSDNPWNLPLVLGLLEFDFIRPIHALRPRLRLPIPNPMQPRLLFLPPDFRTHLFRPLHLLGEPDSWPPILDFHLQPRYPCGPPPFPLVTYELPFVAHWRPPPRLPVQPPPPPPPLPPVEQQPNNDEASSSSGSE